ncbi:phage virion morphogenesis protein [Klebsiella aerogenes]|uniref:phage virion morphogenesis protein n=1 Tax=Klebsiella TaxID=570 RepID=UPI001BCC6B85|nr:phage virion morphogenesis protein [Klebsiella aerogenes]HDS2184586.1 phage virion morphogenesis protein [Klebsiella aerogenes]HDT0435741.1 phage virion morphogenesis protein [Klebsiella aerogenes]HDT4320118.1 phage virion morphogenesis protein [Klebsiella aerogenes]HDT4798929.1 phage virion morphogenesis protein [Klebsiella aerogenes]HDU4048504.1 phage virion morphogenesis protein [Klebsiella aerogenes]
MDELQRVDDWLTALLVKLEPEARKRVMWDLAQQLRQNQQHNIRLQRNPDGTAYEPRRITTRKKKGRIKRQMFAKLRTTKYLKTAATAESATVEFTRKVQRIARVHHYGLRDRVNRGGMKIRYAQRRLLGNSREVANLVNCVLFTLLFK